MPTEDFDEFVRASSQGLLRTAYLLTGDRHLAEDLVQSALVKTALAWKRLDHVSQPAAYVRRVMYNQHVSWWRRRRVAEVAYDTRHEMNAVAADDYVGVDQRLAMRRALLALPPRQRAVIVCRYFEDLSEAATAEVLGMALGTVKSQTSRALTALRTTIPTTEHAGETP